MALSRNEVIEHLKENISDTRQKYRLLGYFKNFMEHLGVENPTCKDLIKCAENYPGELIDILKLLTVKKDFKEKCPVCEDW